MAKKVVTFQLDPALPGEAAAASLALPLLRKAKVDTWADLLAALAGGDEQVQGVMSGIHLSAEQLALLDEHRHVLALVRQNPSVSVAVCPVCGDWFAVEGASPAACPMTFGCKGKPAKAAAAKQKMVDPDELGAVVDTPIEGFQDAEPEPEPASPALRVVPDEPDDAYDAQTQEAIISTDSPELEDFNF